MLLVRWIFVIKGIIEFIEQYDCRLRTWEWIVVFGKDTLTGRLLLVSLLNQASTMLFLNLFSKLNCLSLGAIRLFLSTQHRIFSIHNFWNILSNHALHFLLLIRIVSTHFWNVKLSPWRILGIFHSEKGSFVRNLFVEIDIVD